MEEEKRPEEEPEEQKFELSLPVESTEQNPEELKEYVPNQEEIDRLRKEVIDIVDKDIDAVKEDNITDSLSEKIEQRDEGFLKRMGVNLGKSFRWAVKMLEDRVSKFEIESFGKEVLKELGGKPYLLAANHIKPKNILMQAIGLSPDSFIIRRVVKEETQRTPNAIANVTGKIRKIPIIGQIDRIWSPLKEGIMEGAGFIPVKMKRGGHPAGFNRNFVEKFRDAVERKEPVIIFPQGPWDKDFNPEKEFETGTGHLAKKYDLPVVPVYIKGGRSWSAKEKASVDFGEIIQPENKTKEEITGEIKESLVRLKEDKLD